MVVLMFLQLHCKLTDFEGMDSVCIRGVALLRSSVFI